MQLFCLDQGTAFTIDLNFVCAPVPPLQSVNTIYVSFIWLVLRGQAMTLEYEFRRRSEGWPLRPLSWTSDDVTALQPAHKSPYLILLIWTRLAICAIKHIVWNRLVFHTCIMCRALLSWLHFSNTSTVSNKTFLSHFCLISVYSLVPNRLSIY